MTKTYRCSACGGTYDTEWTEEEACAEFVRLFHRKPEVGEIGRPVCDDCFLKICDSAERLGLRPKLGLHEPHSHEPA